MAAHVTGGLHVTFIQESTNRVCLATALGCRTYKGMGLVAFDVLDRWEGLKEHINR